MRSSEVRLEVINIGDELLNGTAVNTNATWICAQGASGGAVVVAVTMIGDQPEAIREALDRAGGRANLVLVTGGLGPTMDDRTKEVALEYFGGKLVPVHDEIARIRKLFADRGLPLTERNEQQGWVPDTCTVLSNPVGTAPGMEFQCGEVTFVFLPGVPAEMKRIISDHAERWFTETSHDHGFVYGEMMVIGIGESFVADTLQLWERELPDHLTLAYLPSGGLVRIRLSCRRSHTTLNPLSQIAQYLESATRLFPGKAFLTMGASLEQYLVERLESNGQTIATAESCTGGYLSHRITSVPGSSAVYIGSVIAYHNHIKEKMLQVPKEVLEMHGAVSKEVVTFMAASVRGLFNTTFGVAISGIAGPEGGSVEKPVGTVWIAVATEQNVIAEKFLMGTDRIRNIEKSTTASLALVLGMKNEE